MTARTPDKACCNCMLMKFAAMSCISHILFFALSLSLLGACLADFHVEKMGLRVIYPKEARASYDMSLANFGDPIYGGTLMGNLVYPSSDPAYNKVAFTCKPYPCEYGCTFLNESTPQFAIKKEPGRQHIMLLDRGPSSGVLQIPCTFLEKIWHAQLAGADAVIYADDKDGTLLTPDVPSDADLARLLPQIHIPAGFITKADGVELKTLLKQGPVTLVLNWTSILPRAAKVHWEFWTNSNDECGPVCEEQQQFVTALKPTAIALQKENHATFAPHYLLWSCPEQYVGSETCKSQCIKNGTYCCPDPDDNIKEGYSGADVLWMNVRSLCFYRVANQSGEPWLWWEYADKMGEECTMAANKFTKDCSDKMFVAVGGDKLMAGKGQEEWKKCIGTEDDSGSSVHQMLEDELAAQHGDADGSSSVAILPTIRINGAQYRGTLDSKAVTRALCSAFPMDQEPDICNTEDVSEDECKVGGAGYTACHNGTNQALGKTDCINTFTGYECRCGEGFVKMRHPDTMEEYCADVNECLVTNEPHRHKECSCERCTCINDVGGYRCSGPIPSMCTADNNYGGCWKGTFDKTLFHACFDQFKEYSEMAVMGTLNSTFRTYRCQCPPCFKTTPDNTCVPACNLKTCDLVTGRCGARKKSGGGLSGGIIALIVILSMTATAGGMYLVFQQHIRHRMRSDMRDFMLEYMPLAAQEQAAGRRGQQGPQQLQMEAGDGDRE